MRVVDGLDEPVVHPHHKMRHTAQVLERGGSRVGNGRQGLTRECVAGEFSPKRQSEIDSQSFDFGTLRVHARQHHSRRIGEPLHRRRKMGLRLHRGLVLSVLEAAHVSAGFGVRDLLGGDVAGSGAGLRKSSPNRNLAAFAISRRAPLRRGSWRS